MGLALPEAPLLMTYKQFIEDIKPSSRQYPYIRFEIDERMAAGGKVKRPLTDEEVAEIRWYADNYVNYRLDYMHESRGSSRPMGFK